MKSFTNILFIYIIIFLFHNSSSDLSQSPLSFILNDIDYNYPIDQIFNELNQADFNNNFTYNISHAIKFLAPSYFALIIKEIIAINKTTFDFVKNSECLLGYLYDKTNTKMADLVKYSAKTYPDFGDEDGCFSNYDKDYRFILFTIKYDYHKRRTYSGKFKLLPFISTGYSFYGLCIENTDACTSDLLKNMSQSFNSSAGMLSGLDNFTIQIFQNYKNNEGTNAPISYTSFIVIYTIYGIYIIARITIWIIGGRFFKEENALTKGENSEGNSSSEEEEEEEEQKSLTKSKEAFQIDLIEKYNKEESISNKKMYPKFYYIYKLSSFSNGIHILFKKDGNPYYNDSDLYFIFLIRFIALIAKVIHENLKFIIENPSKEINNTNLFRSPLIVISKFSSFGDVIFIICESILVSYKLMSFIREYTPKNSEPSSKLFLNFFLRIIPSAFSILLIFVLYYLFSDSLIILLHFNDKQFYRTKMQHLKQNIIGCNSCIESPKNLIPFYMHYQDFMDQFSEKKNCFQFMIIMVNLFYCYFFCILITFISSKIKKPIFDYIISILFLVSFFLPNNFSCESYLETHPYTNISLLFGETCSIKYTHLFINYYFFGFLIGFALFYNNDITKENSLEISETYKPFHYLKDMIGLVFKSSLWVHILIIIITVGIQILLSFSFVIYIENAMNHNDLQNLGKFDEFLYLNEKTIFALALITLITHLYSYKNESKIKEFGNNILIIVFNRLGYGFYALLEILISIMYLSFELTYSIRAQNLLFAVYGIIFILVITNLFLFITNELPIKMLLKDFLRLK